MWHSEQSALCEEALPPGTLHMSTDFAERYSAVQQNQLQKQFFNGVAVSIMPIVLRWQQPSGGVRKDVLYAVSDAKEQSGRFVEAALDHVEAYFDGTDGKPLFSHFEVVQKQTDGCPVQFKCNQVFAQLAHRCRPEGRWGGIKYASHSYWEAGHGKVGPPWRMHGQAGSMAWCRQSVWRRAMLV